MRATCVSCLTKGSPDKEQGVAPENQLGEFAKGAKRGGDTRPQYVLPDFPESFALEFISAE